MEINNSIPQNHASKGHDEAKSPALEAKPTPDQTKTGVEKTESVMLSEQTKSIQKAQAEMAARPVVDMARVEEVRARLEAQGLDIMRDGEQGNEAARKIADKILNLEAELDHGQGNT